jgi:maltooligosyltrehalose trehalohydrolase
VLRDPFLYTGVYSRHRKRRHGGPSRDLPGDHFVVSIQNHDQVGNRARGDRLAALEPPAAQRLAASLLLLSPYVPLLFMGEEYAEERPFQFFCSFGDEALIQNVRQGRREEFSSFAWQGEVPDPQDEATFKASRLTWSWPAGTVHAGMRHVYSDLLAARRNWPALRNFTERAARLLPDREQPAVLELVRGGRKPEAGKTLEIYFNLTDQPQPLPRAARREEKVLFCSEARRYGGARPATGRLGELLPFECVVFGPRP